MLVDTPQAGAAEVLYGLGAALGRRGGEDLGLIYLQLALYLSPSHPLALLSLADLYEAMKKPELAIKTYERVPLASPLQRNAQIQMAINLDALERTDEAKASLEKLIAAHPADQEAIMALGNILRARKQFAECADVYSKGVDTITKPEKSNWVIYYFRGICYERSKQWPKAEIDLKKSLELFPDQPHVLNYLGYSWVDQGINLDEGMRMIKRAVEQRADDGYIVDSLGWAYLPGRQLRRGGQASRQARSSSSPRTRPSTIISATPTGGSDASSRRASSGRMRATSSRSPKSSPRSRRSSSPGCRRTRPRRRMPRTPRSAAAAEAFGGRAERARRMGARQGQSDAARHRQTPDGYHDIESLVAFADIGDALSFTPGCALALDVRGPTAAAAGDTTDNLVLKAARALAERVAGLKVGRFALSKRLPVAAGLGGGSADAAAALRLLARANRIAPGDPRLLDAARATGADVPVCLDPRPRIMRGIGDVLSGPLDLPRLPAVLVNPGVAVPTKDVFAALRLSSFAGEAGERNEPGGGTYQDSLKLTPSPARARKRGRGHTELVAVLVNDRNDLEAPAIGLAPVIADVLAALRNMRTCQLARMSGSGATCYGLFDSARAATAAARALHQAHPGWWVRATVMAR